MKPAYFFKDRPIFGLDIGYDNLKVMQIAKHGTKSFVTGYGTAGFDSDAFNKDGTINSPEKIAKAAHMLFTKNLVGDITTRRVVMSVPAARTFTRTMTLPKMNRKQLSEAVKQESEQYIPMPPDQLYMDYTVINETDKDVELLAVAIPTRIADSYMLLSQILGLDIVALETTISASCRLFVHTEQSDVPTVLIDFGTVSSDITIYDDALIVTSTVLGGGDSFTELIAKYLGMSQVDANTIKSKYGLGVSKKQKEISEALAPLLDQLLKEIRRMIRYYEDRSTTKRKISQIVTLGGGASMPGLSEFMTSHLRLPVRMCDPWHKLSFGHIAHPTSSEKSLYGTVAGLALIESREIFE